MDHVDKSSNCLLHCLLSGCALLARSESERGNGVIFAVEHRQHRFVEGALRRLAYVAALHCVAFDSKGSHAASLLSRALGLSVAFGALAVPVRVGTVPTTSMTFTPRRGGNVRFHAARWIACALAISLFVALFACLVVAKQFANRAQSERVVDISRWHDEFHIEWSANARAKCAHAVGDSDRVGRSTGFRDENTNQVVSASVAARAVGNARRTVFGCTENALRQLTIHSRNQLRRHDGTRMLVSCQHTGCGLFGSSGAVAAGAPAVAPERVPPASPALLLSTGFDCAGEN
eukprot:6213997-Pleurochrysis_carterae.AAC.2